MNFESKIDKAMADAKEALEKVKKLSIEFEDAKNFTSKFLEKCAAKGITKVSIGIKSHKVPVTKSWPFGFSGSVFSFVPEKNKNHNESQPIWRIVESFGIHGGAGNTDQCQLSPEGDKKLIDGVYELRSGQWKKVN